MKHDPVNHPRHYTSHPSGVEAIEITRCMGFNLGNAWKYIARSDHKGNRSQDLAKALWYVLDDIKQRRQDRGVTLPHIDMPEGVLLWIDAESALMRSIYIQLWNANVSEDIDGLMRVAKALRAMADEVS